MRKISPFSVYPALHIIAAFALVTLILTAISCNSKTESTPQTNAQESATGGSSFSRLDGTQSLGGQPRSVGGVTFRPPSEWIDLGGGGMRAASYALAETGKNGDSTMVAVFYFQQGGGGNVQDNITRWVNQVTPEDGKTRDQAAIHDHFTVKQMNVTTVEIDGSYTPAMGPGAAAGPKAGYRLVGAVVEGPEGNLFFRLTGPKEMTEKMLPGFVSMIKQIGRFGTGASAG